MLVCTNQLLNDSAISNALSPVIKAKEWYTDRSENFVKRIVFLAQFWNKNYLYNPLAQWHITKGHTCSDNFTNDYFQILGSVTITWKMSLFLMICSI